MHGDQGEGDFALFDGPAVQGMKWLRHPSIKRRQLSIT